MGWSYISASPLCLPWPCHLLTSAKQIIFSERCLRNGIRKLFTSVNGLVCLQRKHLAYVFRKKGFLRRGVVSTSPKPQAGGPPRVGCPRLLIQYIRSYPPNWRPFLHLQPEDAPCRGDRDPLITYDIYYSCQTYTFTNIMHTNIDADSSYKLQKETIL